MLYNRVKYTFSLVGVALSEPLLKIAVQCVFHGSGSKRIALCSGYIFYPATREHCKLTTIRYSVSMYRGDSI